MQEKGDFSVKMSKCNLDAMDEAYFTSAPVRV